MEMFGNVSKTTSAIVLLHALMTLNWERIIVLENCHNSSAMAMMLNATFNNYIVAVSFIGGGNRSTGVV